MDKLTIIRRALNNTSNHDVNLDDGSDEWNTAELAFTEAIDDLIPRHKWPFATKEKALNQVAAAANPSQTHQYAYALPADSLHIRVVHLEAASSIPPAHRIFTDYELMSGHLCTDHDTATGGRLIARYVYAPADALWHPQATKILTLYTEAGILRGLNEDFDEAKKREDWAEARLMEARSHVDQQNPGRNMVRSGVAAARRTRRG